MKHITADLFDQLSHRAAELPRRRTNQNLHESFDSPVQRMLMALEPGTYIRPHRHAEPNKWELLLVLRGALSVLCFDDEGRVRTRLELAAGGAQSGVELPPAEFHMLVVREPGTVTLEAKEGPYRPSDPADFAPWAPAEGAPAAAGFEAWAGAAAVGERWS